MKYFKLLFSLLFLIPTIIIAEEHYCCPYEKFQPGFYGGLQAGASFLHAKGSVSSFIPPDEEGTLFNTRIHTTRGNIGARFGYLYRCGNSPFVFAPELFISYNPSEKKQIVEGEVFDYKTKTMFSLGGNLRFGSLLLEDLLLYGFIGVTGSTFTFEVVDNTVGQSLGSDRKFEPAFSYGGGIEHEIGCGHRIRAEISYSNYRKANFAVIGNDNLTFHRNTIKPRICAINLIYTIPF